MPAPKNSPGAGMRSRRNPSCSVNTLLLSLLKRPYIRHEKNSSITHIYGPVLGFLAFSVIPGLTRNPNLQGILNQVQDDACPLRHSMLEVAAGYVKNWQVAIRNAQFTLSE